MPLATIAALTTNAAGTVVDSCEPIAPNAPVIEPPIALFRSITTPATVTIAASRKTPVSAADPSDGAVSRCGDETTGLSRF
jgi:hypothetical protein